MVEYQPLYNPLSETDVEVLETFLVLKMCICNPKFCPRILCSCVTVRLDDFRNTDTCQKSP